MPKNFMSDPAHESDAGNTSETKTKKTRKKPPHLWKPGQSGNPGGRPKVMVHVRELAKAYTEDAIKTLAKIMGDKKEKAPARVRAAEVILNRAWGRAPEALEITGAGGGPIQLQQDAKDDLSRIIASIATRHREDGVPSKPH